MNLKELKTKNITEINKLIKDLRLDLESIATNVLQQKEKNVKKGSFIKKDIARLKTLLNQKIKEESNKNA